MKVASRVKRGSLESTVQGLFISAPYPGDQKFFGQPTGLLYALSVLADRKLQKTSSKEIVSVEMPVWAPAGVTDFSNSKLKEELTDYITEHRPKVVGISTFSASYQNALAIKDLVKKIAPETLVVFGGAHEDNFVKHYRKNDRIDADLVVAGDGSHLLDAVYSIVESNPHATVEEIKQNIYSRREELESLPGTGLLLLETKTGIESITTNAAEHKRLRKQTLLGALPIMPRYLLQNEDEVSSGFDIFQNPKEENLKTAQVMVGQGCPYACAFCSEGIGTVWYDDDAPNAREPRRSIEHLEKELQELKQEGYEAIFFDDSTFFAKPKKYLAEVLDLLAKYEFRWGCQTTQKSIHAMKEFLPKMREAGMDYVYIGIEHYSGEIRDNFGKNVRGGVKVSGNVEHTLSMLEEAEVSVGISLTFGHPDTNSPTQSTTETLASARYAIDRTKELIQMYHNVVGVSCNLVTYHPGTPISEMFEREVGPVDYTGLPNQSAVYAQFEEGMGPHAAGLTDSLVNFIANYAAEKFGKKLWM